MVVLTAEQIIRPPVSVCIATYNGEKFILQQLQSILAQLAEYDEVIISDDSSTDQTLAIIYSLNDSRIKVFPGQTFRSPIKNFEFALQQASHDYIFLSDQDDIWVEGRVDAMMKVLETADMVVCDHSVIDEQGNILMPSYFELVPSRPGLLHNLKKNTYYGCCMAFRRRVLEKAFPFPKDVPLHDIWLGFVSEIYFKTIFLDYPYTLYRKHANNATTGTEIKSSNSLLKKLQIRYNTVKYLPTLLFRNLKK